MCAKTHIDKLNNKKKVLERGSCPKILHSVNFLCEDSLNVFDFVNVLLFSWGPNKTTVFMFASEKGVV